MSRQIHTLESLGYRVKIAHWRLAAKDELEVLANLKDEHFQRNAYPKHRLRQLGLEVSPRGGATTVGIYSPDGDPLASGESVCSPLDNFCKKIGLEIALGRATSRLFGGPGTPEDFPKLVIGG